LICEREIIFNTLSRTQEFRKAVAPFFQQARHYMSSLGLYYRHYLYGRARVFAPLAGDEKGINDKALKRGIVMHAADYWRKIISSKEGIAAAAGLSRHSGRIPATGH